MFGRTTVLITVLGVLTVVSAQTAKHPWALTLDERIALRTDPERARERAAIHASTTAFTRVADAFNGKTHRELFMPTQVFEVLVQNAYVGLEWQTDAFRRAKTNEALQQGLPADFWNRLETVAALYIADARAVHVLGRSLTDVQGTDRRRVLDEISTRQRYACSSRADALTAARREFGAEPFDRFLYEAVAANMFHVSGDVPHAAQLRLIESGCR